MKFTIGLPIIKTEYLQATLDGIQNQTFTDYEVVIKNNASTPEKKAEIKKVCSEWIGKENVKYFESNEQLSMTANFNSILEHAKGDYFTIMSDDDIMEPEYLQEFALLSSKYPDVKVFHCRVKRIDGNGSLLDFSENCPEWESQIDFIYQRMKSKRTLYLSDFLVDTQALKEIGGFPIESFGWGCDEITWCRLAYNGIGFTPKVLLKYRRFLGNFSMSKENLLKRFKDVELIDEIINNIITNNTAKKDCLYPQSYLQNLNAHKTQKQKDFVLEHFAKSSNYIGILLFFAQNKKELTYKGLFKAIILKTFFKNKFYNAV
ncbi:glycosyltransferase family A protein [Algoriphagus sp. NG3]|uniref:glycosyltransferase family 2 protein n=1 Tax=Algoriphagus sp. NG3 TaxID=3097546 RepID=UPI002A82BB02|nr:glycosyltransferase family A protein [Algoriphagus sp. NG3]WPR73543.1 glycosyltransferase family A protein [Algoriphagus sp. NG3]